MQYFSTNRQSAHVSFGEATLKGQPEDKGLYFPETIPRLSEEFWKDFQTKSKAQIAFEVIKPFVGDSIDDEKLLNICTETVNFEFPLIKITENISTLELFHGATLAFKDVGARFMSRCLRYFSQEKSEKTIVIVATSGDTGGAVANGFDGVEGIEHKMRIHLRLQSAQSCFGQLFINAGEFLFLGFKRLLRLYLF